MGLKLAYGDPPRCSISSEQRLCELSPDGEVGTKWINFSGVVDSGSRQRRWSRLDTLLGEKIVKYGDAHKCSYGDLDQVLLRRSRRR